MNRFPGGDEAAVRRVSKWVLVAVAVLFLLSFRGRLVSLFRVNQMAILQARAEEGRVLDAQEQTDWFLPDYVAGRGHARGGKDGSAIPLLERAYRRNPEHASLQLELGLAHLREGSFKQGLSYLREVPGIEGRTNFNYLVDQGWEQVLANRDLSPEEQDWSLAERFYRAAVSLSPQERQVHRALIEFYVFWSRDSVEARRALQAAEVFFPEWDVKEQYFSRIGAPLPKKVAISTKEFDPTPRPPLPGSASLQPGVWTTPILVQETQREIHSPVIVADIRGVVHCLWIELAGEDPAQESQIFHSRLVDRKWTLPAPIHRDSWAAFLWATSTPSGSLVATWSAPNAELLTRELIPGSPGLPGGWSPVRTLAKGRGNLQMIEGSESLHVAYPFRGAIRHRTSKDGGKHWSDATVIREQNRHTSPDFAAIGMDSVGSLHVLWTEFELPRGWPPRGILHSRSDDLGKSWSQPLRLTGPEFDQAGIVVGPDDSLHVAYNGMAGTGGRYHITSTDGGLNWSPPVRITPLGATEGTPQMVFDRKGRLHLATTGVTWVLYSRFQAGQWNQPIRLAGGESRESYWHEQPSMCVVDGRVLHIVYWDLRKRLYYRMLVLDR